MKISTPDTGNFQGSLFTRVKPKDESYRTRRRGARLTDGETLYAVTPTVSLHFYGSPTVTGVVYERRDVRPLEVNRTRCLACTSVCGKVAIENVKVYT